MMRCVWINQVKTHKLIIDWRNGWIRVQGSQRVHGTFGNVSVLSRSVPDCCISFSKKSLFRLPTPSLKVNFAKCSSWHLSLFSATLNFVLWESLLCFSSLFFPGHNVFLLKWWAEKSGKFRLNTIVLTDCAPWRAVNHIKFALYLDKSYCWDEFLTSEKKYLNNLIVICQQLIWCCESEKLQMD